ncbi:MAG: glycosyltransferase [Promethearchaeia archaeon]
METISIIIPTTRPENSTLESFFQFTVPDGFILEYFFIVDDPEADLSHLRLLAEKYARFAINILRNATNLGTSASRNKGIEESTGEYILTLDDDCVAEPDLIEQYIHVMRRHPNHPGYIGLTSAPEPKTSFEKAINLSDMRHFFEIANHKDTFYWGITANLFIKRAAIDGIRFSSDHPKKGGGEDISFCLKVLDYCNRDSNESAESESLLSEPKQTKSLSNYTKFKCVPSAKVEHPYWEESIKGYLRFFRWGYGDVILHEKFPKYRFHQYPNLIEFIFLFLMIHLSVWALNSIFSLIPFTFPVFGLFFGSVAAFIIWELICEARKLKENVRTFSLIPLLKAVLIRQLNDMGRFLHQFPRIWKVTCRWDYFCTGESLAYETKAALRKFEGFVAISLLIIIIYLILI